MNLNLNLETIIRSLIDQEFLNACEKFTRCLTPRQFVLLATTVKHGNELLFSLSENQLLELTNLVNLIKMKTSTFFERMKA